MVDIVDLQSRGSLLTDFVWLVSDVYNGLSSLTFDPPVQHGLDVDLWQYRTYRERTYKYALCSQKRWIRGPIVTWCIWMRCVSDARSSNRILDTTTGLRQRTGLTNCRGSVACCLCAAVLCRTNRWICTTSPSGCEIDVLSFFRRHTTGCSSDMVLSSNKNRGSSTLVVTYTEFFAPVLAGLLIVAYMHLRLLYEPPDIMQFACQLGMALETVLHSRPNVRELFEILDVIKSTRLDQLPSSWSARGPHADDHHMSRRGG